MTLDILLDLLQAIGRFLVNPLLYIAVLFTLFLGYRRVKRERKSFHIRILEGGSEAKNSLLAGLLLSLILSVGMIAAGVVLEPQFLMVYIAVTVLALICFVFHFLSPAVLFAVTMLLLVLMEKVDMTFRVFVTEVTGISWLDELVVPVCIAAGLLVIAEGVLIQRYGAEFASPMLEKTKRGMQAVSYLSKQVWILPMFVLIPGNLIPSFMPYWPQLTLGEASFSFVLFPFVIGFQQLTRKTLPIYFYPKLAKAVTLVGVLLVIGGIVGYFMVEVAFIVLMTGAVLRLIVALQYKMQERNDIYAVTPTSTGAMIAAVLPNSPAEKMGLVAGEVIKRVNGREVQDEGQLYEALQVNAAHCKLEVLDHNKELRLTQHVVHSDDHHGIGLLLTK